MLLAALGFAGLNVKANQYASLADALVKIARMEGYRGLYKGLAPNLMKAAPSSALTFMFYEKLVSLLSTDSSPSQ
eukprot:1184136-Prorocentrum_minimum.AAC.3